MTVFLPVVAFLFCAILHRAALCAFPRWGLLDFPERYGLQRLRLPYPTGILAVTTFLLFYYTLESSTMKTWGVVLGILLLSVISFLDDRTPLPSSIRLLVQVVVATVIFLTGTRIFSLTNPLASLTGSEVLTLDTLVIPWAFFSDPSFIGLLFTVLWLGLTMNAMNWLDGIPGQVGTLALIGFLTIGALALSERVGQPDLARLAFILAGISAACLLFDFPPPKVLMGDTGAIFFGLMLGVLTIYAGGKVATAFLVLGVPLIDSILVVLRRIIGGRSPFHGGERRDEHFHHRLLQRGWTQHQVIALTTVIGTSFGVTALFLNTAGKFAAGMLLFVLMGALSWYSRPA